MSHPWNPSQPSTTSTASRPGGGWTRSCSPTSWSSTTSCERAVRPVDRGRGGFRLLPAREPRGEAGRVRLADGRRLAAHADGGERVVPDRGLQRRDDRAHRASRGAPPGALRRKSGRRRPRLLRPRPTADPRLDRAALRLRWWRLGLRPPRWPTGRSYGPSWGTRRRARLHRHRGRVRVGATYSGASSTPSWRR